MSRYTKVFSSKLFIKLAVAVFVLVANCSLRAQDHVVTFKTSDTGVSAAITNWGYDTGWNNPDNIQRSIIFMGTNVVNCVRVIAAESSAMNNGSSIWNSTLSAADQNYLSNMVNEIRGYTPNVKWYMYCDGGITNWYSSGYNRLYPDRYAALWNANLNFLNTLSNRPTVTWVDMANEPDDSSTEGSPQDYYNTLGYLQANANFTGKLMGGCATLNSDVALNWFSPLVPRATLGSTHNLAGSCQNYVNFLQTVTVNNAVSFEPEVHNVGECIIGANYGLNGVVWWGPAELARGQFAQACQGSRLGYSEDQTKWTASAVYRAPSQGVVFYQDYNYGGANSLPLAAGTYTSAQLAAAGIPSASASSVKIPAGWALTMFSGDNFTGTSWTLTANTANFGTLNPSANDLMYSCIVQSSGGMAQAFVGASERTALTTTYQFFSKDRDVFYDGDGPRRDYNATLIGSPTYGAGNDNEKVVNITWGADVPPAISGRYLIVNRNSGKVLEVPGAAKGNGVILDQNTYTNGLNQQWDINPIPNTFGGDFSYFTVKAAHDGVTMDLNGYSYANGGQVQQWNGGTNVLEQWYFQYVSNGWFKIRSRWCSKGIRISGASTANGAVAVQWDDISALDQQWRLIPAGVSSYDLVAPAPPTSVTATANAASVRLNWKANTESDLAGYTVLRGLNSGGPYEICTRGLTTNTFTDKFANQVRNYYYVVKAVDRSLNASVNSAQVVAQPTGAKSLIANYTFEGNGNDSSGNANNVIITNGTLNFAGVKYSPGISFDGTSQSLLLPANLLASVTNFTIATWVYWGGGAQWQRIFDFGNGTTQYMFLTPNSGNGTLRFAINSGAGEQIVETAVMPSNQWRHVAVTLNNHVCSLYTNGVLAATAAVTNFPAVFNPALNYLGKSQFADPLFAGKLSAFSIYNYALNAGQIAQLSASPLTNSHAPIASYPMDGNVNDTSGNGLNGVVIGQPTYVAGKFGSAISLDGAANYVALPAAVMAGVTNFTFAAWVYWNGGGAWQRIFDFGNNTTQYMYLTPGSGGGALRFAISTNSTGGEQGVETSPPPTGTWQHVALTRNGNTMKLYVNGLPAATNNAVTIAPASINPVLNYLGKSQWADPLFNGCLDAVCIYNYALTDSEIARLTNNVPPPPNVPTTLAVTLAGNVLNLSWSSNYLGCRLQIQTNALDAGLGTNWFDVPNATSTNSIIAPLNFNNESVFYRLVYP